jgi:hypothetical protein
LMDWVTDRDGSGRGHGFGGSDLTRPDFFTTLSSTIPIIGNMQNVYLTVHKYRVYGGASGGLETRPLNSHKISPIKLVSRPPFISFLALSYFPHLLQNSSPDLSLSVPSKF